MSFFCVSAYSYSVAVLLFLPNALAADDDVTVLPNLHDQCMEVKFYAGLFLDYRFGKIISLKMRSSESDHEFYTFTQPNLHNL